MRKKLLILIMAVAFAAASLVPATAFAGNLIKQPVCHNGELKFVEPHALQAHFDHGDVAPTQPELTCP